MLTRDGGHYAGGGADHPSFPLCGELIAKRTFIMFKQQSEARGDQTALVEEMIGGQKVVQAFNYEEEAWSILTRLIKDWRTAL